MLTFCFHFMFTIFIVFLNSLVYIQQLVAYIWDENLRVGGSCMIAIIIIIILILITIMIILL